MSASIVSLELALRNDEQCAFDYSFRKFSRTLHQWICGVCGDGADSKHYGAYACNGCKGFFRRTVWNSRKYTCKNIGDCPVVKEIRIACKACRFAKCLKVGMNPKELHSSRKQGSMKQNICSSEQNSHQVIEISAVESRATALIANPCFDRSQIDALLMLDRHILRRVDPLAPLTHWKTTTGSTEVSFLTAFLQPSLVSSRTEIPLSSDRIADVSDVVSDFQRKFVLYADWLNEFHDFQTLPKYVQLILAKTCCSTYCWAISAWRTLHSGCAGISFINGSYFPRDPKVMCLPDSRNVIHLFMEDLIGSMKSLKIDETEYNLLKIINLFTEDSLELSESEKKLVRNKRDKYVEILSTYVQSRYPLISEQDAACRVGELMLLLASLTHIVYLSNDNLTTVDTLKIAHLGELTCEIHRNQ